MRKENRNLNTKREEIYSCSLAQLHNTTLNTTDIRLTKTITTLAIYDKL